MTTGQNGNNVDMTAADSSSTSPTSAQVEHVKQMITAPIRESADVRTAPLNIPRAPLDNSSELPSMRNPLTANVVNPMEIEKQAVSVAAALPLDEAVMRSRQGTPFPPAVQVANATMAAMAIPT